MMTEGREKNSQVIARNRESVLLNTSETLFRRESSDEYDPSRTPPEKSGQVDSNPAKIAETAKKIGWNKPTSSRRNFHQIHRQLWSLLRKHQTHQQAR